MTPVAPKEPQKQEVSPAATQAGQRWRFTGSNAFESLERLAVMLVGVVLMKSGTSCVGHVTDAVQWVQGWTSTNPEAADIIGAALAFIGREWHRKEPPPCDPSQHPSGSAS